MNVREGDKSNQNIPTARLVVLTAVVPEGKAVSKSEQRGWRTTARRGGEKRTRGSTTGKRTYQW